MTSSVTSSAPGNEAARNATRGPESGQSRRAAIIAVVICWGLVVFDGYDLIVYGTVQNSLIESTGWGLNAASAGTLGSMAFVGMMLGAVFAGRLSDAWGRRKAIILCTIIFSVATVLCAFAPSALAFGLLRLVAGLGLGGLVPSANALAAELIPSKWRGSMATLMMSGVPIGGTIAALLGLGVIPAFGWQPMFLVAIIPLVLFVPLGLAFFPETLGAARTAAEDAASTAPGSESAARTTPRGGFAGLFRGGFGALSILFAASTLFTLFAWYGLGTQLPKIMHDSGANLGPALTFTIALNLGAVAGSIITAWAGDKFGTVKVSVIAAGLAGIALIALLVTPASNTAFIYAALVIAGVGTHGTQSLVIGAIASHYPSELRGTALGWALGIGRIGAVLAPQLSGLMLATKTVPPSMNFLMFGGAAIVSAVFLAVIVARDLKSRKTALVAA
ncbi:aromatic acid/H+ symport family MFS transporter [Sinomonas sp. ASV486]|uniref:MFS transporter n=1 Tax=Sinomonas sp. ASV486 TaxID=3051170 RepID=UPI0027DB6A3E|nr:aromatic acid/H+ symport family MFS transporter [Sinomonas sp. ASV486]MDQ4490075.1 aromatic acid/H+ symport family MFS transporter [Sinomonas sp. ASV486]